MFAVFLTVAVAVAACENDTVTPDQYTLEVVSGADQSAGAGAAVSQPVAVRVSTNGKPAVGVMVIWRAIEGGGKPSQLASTTDANGIATINWTLGIGNGQQLLLASAGNGSITIRATSLFAVASVSAGFRHNCLLSTTGVAYCWGDNNQGQLGTDQVFSSSSPRKVDTQLRFASISAGWFHTCAVTSVGELYCWGDNSAGQLSVPGISRSFAPILASTNLFKSVSPGFVHTCAVTTLSVTQCWGSNDRGQLGAAAITNATDVSAGEFHTCAINTARSLMCWGFNSNGELGRGLVPGVVSATPQPVAGSETYIAVSNGPRHSCAVASSGQVFCWGLNGRGETGQPPFAHVSTPVPVTGATNYSTVGIGNEHACGLSNGRAFCWGGLLGNGTTATSLIPVAVSGQLTFSSLSVGYANTCGVSTGEVWCWDATSLAPRRISFTP